MALTVTPDRLSMVKQRLGVLHKNLEYAALALVRGLLERRNCIFSDESSTLHKTIDKYSNQTTLLSEQFFKLKRRRINIEVEII
jgi:hypothetical protein